MKVIINEDYEIYALPEEWLNLSEDELNKKMSECNLIYQDISILETYPLADEPESIFPEEYENSKSEDD